MLTGSSSGSLRSSRWSAELVGSKYLWRALTVQRTIRSRSVNWNKSVVVSGNVDGLKMSSASPLPSNSRSQRITSRPLQVRKQAVFQVRRVIYCFKKFIVWSNDSSNIHVDSNLRTLWLYEMRWRPPERIVKRLIVYLEEKLELWSRA
jgi:hypothetical protein